MTTLGEFIAGGPEPVVREDETIWETCRMTDAVPFAYECGKSLSGRRFARISFGSGKTVGIPHCSVHGAFAVYRLPDGRFLLTSREGTMWEEAYRVDADEESVGMIVDGKFARIPDGATGIREIRRGGSDGNFSFCAETPDGDVKISGTEPVGVLYLGARYIGTVTEDCLFRTGEDVAFASAFSGYGDGSAAAGGDPEPDFAGLIEKLRRLGEEKLKKAIDDATGWSVSWEGRAGDRAFRVFRSGGESCVASFALDGDAADWTVETEGRCNAPEAARHAAAVAAYGELKRLAK